MGNKLAIGSAVSLRAVICTWVAGEDRKAEGSSQEREVQVLCF